MEWGYDEGVPSCTRELTLIIHSLHILDKAFNLFFVNNIIEILECMLNTIIILLEERKFALRPNSVGDYHSTILLQSIMFRKYTLCWLPISMFPAVLPIFHFDNQHAVIHGVLVIDENAQNIENCGLYSN